MLISVIICTRGRADSLRRTLSSLFSGSNLKSSNWEVIVADNDSRDHTAQICADFADQFPDYFRYLVEEKHGKSNALNSAIAAAKGEILAFTDDDVLCPPDYIRAIRTVVQQHTAGAIQGRILLECEGGHPEWLDRHLGLTVGWRDCGDQISDLEGTLCGTNMIVRADVFQKIGGFSPELGPGIIGLGEETELSLRMREAGYRMIYAPQILVRHRLSKKRLTRAFIRKRFFQQGRAEAYYEDLPVSLLRFGLYVVKETILEEVSAIRHLWAGHSALALRSQCEARSQAGLFWQHFLFKLGHNRRLSAIRMSRQSVEVTSLR